MRATYRGGATMIRDRAFVRGDDGKEASFHGSRPIATEHDNLGEGPECAVPKGPRGARAKRVGHGARGAEAMA